MTPKDIKRIFQRNCDVTAELQTTKTGGCNIRTYTRIALKNVVAAFDQRSLSHAVRLKCLTALEDEISHWNWGRYRGLDSYLREASLKLAAEGHAKSAIEALSPILLTRSKEYIRVFDNYAPVLALEKIKHRLTKGERTDIRIGKQHIAVARQEALSIIRMIVGVSKRYKVKLTAQVASLIQAARAGDIEQMRAALKSA